MDNDQSSFVIDIQKIRDRARADIAEGAVTEGYRADRKTVVRLLNEALATEIVCTLRYRRHYFMSGALGGIAGFAIRDELLQHAKDEQEHADRIAERIVQLGGEPNFDPEGLTSRSHADYSEGAELADMLREDLIAERIAIDTYGEIIRYIGDGDPTTRRMFEQILEQEEEHADELSDFLRRLGSAPRAESPR
ncbi:MAG: ferritin-like domain-containing protein [Myxococcota bacterium]